MSAGTVPLPKEGATEAAMSVRKAAVKQWITEYRERKPSAAEVAAPVADKGAAAEIEKRKKKVQAWIEAWRSAPPPPPPPAAPARSKREIAARKKEAQAWIADWRAKPAPVSSPQDEVRAWITNWRAGVCPNCRCMPT